VLATGGCDAGQPTLSDGPGYTAARRALAAAYGSPAGDAGSGGSIPLLHTLQTVAPNAEFILWPR
jgi:hypothetical protein